MKGKRVLEEVDIKTTEDVSDRGKQWILKEVFNRSKQNGKAKTKGK